MKRLSQAKAELTGDTIEDRLASLEKEDEVNAAAGGTESEAGRIGTARFAAPAFGEIGVDAELIQRAHHHVIHQRVDRLRMIVERRHRRQDHRAHPRQLQHVLQMDFVQRRLAHQQHQLAALLQDHVGRAVDQVVALAARDGRQRPHAARRDHHAGCQERAARNRRPLIVGRDRSTSPFAARDPASKTFPRPACARPTC